MFGSGWAAASLQLLLLGSRRRLLCGERGQPCLLSGNCCCLNWFVKRSDVLFGLTAWEQKNTHVFSAYSNRSQFLMNEEVRIRSFRFSSLKGPFKCIRGCVIWSGRSRSLGVGGHDDLASFSCFSWVLMPSLRATIPPSRARAWPTEALSLLSLPVGKS